MQFTQFNSDDAGPTKSSEKHAKAFPLCGQYLQVWMNPMILQAKVPQRWNAFVEVGQAFEVEAYGHHIELGMWQPGP